MKLEDYSKYYIQGSDHYLVPKDEFIELFNEMINWKKETKELKKELNYIRSGEYYNQLRFERDMLQQVVDTNGVPSEVYDYIECVHRNTELLEENEKLKAELGLYRGSLHREHEAIHRANDLEDENNELKKQLDKANDELYTLKNKYNIRLLNQISENIEPDCEDYYLVEIETKANKYDLIQTQQQEFINYLEDEISKYSEAKEYAIEYHESNLLIKKINVILQKYKEIIGNDINVGSKGGNKDEY